MSGPIRDEIYPQSNIMGKLSQRIKRPNLAPITASQLKGAFAPLVLTRHMAQTEDENAWDYSAQGGEFLCDEGAQCIYDELEIFNMVKQGRMVYVIENNCVFHFERYDAGSQTAFFGCNNYANLGNTALLDRSEVIAAVKGAHYVLTYSISAVPENIKIISVDYK